MSMSPRHSAVVNAILTLGLLILVSPARAEKDKFTDTSTGSDDTSAAYGGISKEEAAILQKGMQKKIKNFKAGRTSSGSGDNVESRYSGVFEMHDADFDGVTDHDGGANAMEAASEKTAAGSLGLRGAARQKKMDEIKAQNCKGAKNVNACLANSKSSVLMDRGPAHGADKPNDYEQHRVYELDEKVQKAAKEAGKQYANQAAFDASEATPDGVYTKKGSKKNTVSVTTSKGKKEVEIGPNIDLLRDEASKLEQIKQREVNNQWKFLRAERLVKGYISTIASSIPVGAKENPQGYSSKALQDDLLESRQGFFHNSRLSDLVSTSYRDADTEANVAAYDSKFSAGLESLVRQMLSEHKVNATGQNQKDLNKQMADSTKKLTACMKSGTYCHDGTQPARMVKGKQVNSAFDVEKGDPGNTFTDTREYIYERVDAANRGGAANFKRNMQGNSDFNDHTDSLQKGSEKSYGSMMKQADANNQTVNAFIAQEKAKGKDSSMNLNGYNPNIMGAAQLSKRDLSRGDGSTLGGIGQGNGAKVVPYGSGGSPAPSNYGTGYQSNTPAPASTGLGRNY